LFVFAKGKVLGEIASWHYADSFAVSCCKIAYHPLSVCKVTKNIFNERVFLIFKTNCTGKTGNYRFF